MATYRRRLHSLLTPAEHRLFARLDSPQKIQDFLDRLPVNFSLDGDTAMSPRSVLKARMAHCAEGAIFAAAALAYHGRPPLLMDIRALPADQDHIITLFQERGLWGAISKTNHAILRWRDPIYASARELAMTYAHEYCLARGQEIHAVVFQAILARALCAQELGDRAGRSRLAAGRSRYIAACAGGAEACTAKTKALPRGSSCCHRMWWNGRIHANRNASLIRRRHVPDNLPYGTRPLM